MFFLGLLIAAFSSPNVNQVGKSTTIHCSFANTGSTTSQSVKPRLYVEGPRNGILTTTSDVYEDGRIRVLIGLLTIKLTVNNLKYNDEFIVECQSQSYQNLKRLLIKDVKGNALMIRIH